MTHKIILPGFERTDQRGLFREIINSGQWRAVNWAKMLPGSSLGNHYHKKTVLFLYLINGLAHVKTIDVNTGLKDEFRIKSGQGVFFKPFESHVIDFESESEVLMLKSLRYDPKDSDIFHYPV